MIQVRNLAKSFGTQLLFEDVNFVINKGERVSLLGRNGSGKTTLFKIIAGEMSQDGGEMITPKGYSIGTLSQHISFSKPTVLEECTSVLIGERAFEGHLAEKILFGLGLKGADLHRKPEEFSGGFQIRIMLAKLLLQNHNMLLLDEPTNYLDIVSVRWLKRFLKSFPGEMILISHDRDFLDDVATHTMGLKRQRLKKITGSSKKYVEQLLQEDETYELTKRNLDKKRKDLEQFVERFKAKATKATQAQSRMKMLEKMDTMDDLAVERQLGLKFSYAPFTAKSMMAIENLSFSFDGTKNIIEGLTFQIGKKDRIAIIGKNGKGKSTLLNLLGKELTPKTGSIDYHQAVQIGHFGQTNIERLNGQMSVVEEIGSVAGDAPTTRIRAICGSLMFDGDLAQKKVKILSGGERSRVLLGKIVAKACNILLLDEPTNHLDIEAIDTLISEIESFEGAVILVTHSEMILRKLATKLIVFNRDKTEVFEGNYDEFLEKIGWEDEQEVVVNVGEEKISYKEQKRLRAELITKRSRALGPIKEEITRLENLICELEEEVSDKNQQIIDHSATGGGVIIANLSRDIAKINERIDALFLELEKNSEKLHVDSIYFEQELSKIEQKSVSE